MTGHRRLRADEQRRVGGGREAHAVLLVLAGLAQELEGAAVHALDRAHVEAARVAVAPRRARRVAQLAGEGDRVLLARERHEDDEHLRRRAQDLQLDLGDHRVGGGGEGVDERGLHGGIDGVAGRRPVEGDHHAAAVTPHVDPVLAVVPLRARVGLEPAAVLGAGLEHRVGLGLGDDPLEDLSPAGAPQQEHESRRRERTGKQPRARAHVRPGEAR